MTKDNQSQTEVVPSSSAFDDLLAQFMEAAQLRPVVVSDPLPPDPPVASKPSTPLPAAANALLTPEQAAQVWDEETKAGIQREHLRRVGSHGNAAADEWLEGEQLHVRGLPLGRYLGQVCLRGQRKWHTVTDICRWPEQAMAYAVGWMRPEHARARVVRIDSSEDRVVMECKR